MSDLFQTHAVVREVGLRDGLQSLQRVMPTEFKQQWIQRAYEAGMREIEVASFVPPKLLPQMADAAEVVAFACSLPELLVVSLVPNAKGAERAIAAGAQQLILPISASYAHSMANVRKTPDDMIAEVKAICALRDGQTAHGVTVEAGIGTAFGCALQGSVSEAEVLRLAEAALTAGADCISLADTVGYADPAYVRRLFRQVKALAGDRFICGHFHDTRGLALANIYASLEAGVARFDASLAGIGGCPFAPGATGNVATEDVVFMLEQMGISTGINLAALLDVRQYVGEQLQGECLSGSIYTAGLPKHFSQTGAMAS
ncbi:hydroxymethylglutaryl-CoA lyase [Pokkaliibacter plantistimulans]|uniref:Hydroxymethylglutaryl-CoA lyase n=1 Tax=Proteobacteria bacterium 228 TaxID=2083153 RepID=A0A2S5KM20_9PROT|nr:hydroxymethylglutaryl-CoA lyase [Pokkaliibacter plantistimulans]PPC75695.1 hydroxymethylglutaryl-CoA lyase [Pokkaliibacter plantistimulans]